MRITAYDPYKQRSTTSQTFDRFTSTIPENKAYLTIDANAAKLAVNFGGSVSTGINAVGAASLNADGATYNIAGQRVGASYKGIVVKNGKKYLRK